MRGAVWSRRAAVVLGLTVLVVAVGVRGTRAGEDERRGREDWSGFDWRSVQGLKISPVPLDVRHKDRMKVGLGSYLVNAVGSCNDCHTWPNYRVGHDPFQGQPAEIPTERYLAGGRAFGPFISPNLTPDAQGRPAGLTLQAFKNALRTGHDPADPGQLLQVMPWPVLRNMLDMDLEAIYAYLTAIPSIGSPPTPAP